MGDELLVLRPAHVEVHVVQLTPQAAGLLGKHLFQLSVIAPTRGEHIEAMSVEMAGVIVGFVEPRYIPQLAPLVVAYLEVGIMLGWEGEIGLFSQGVWASFFAPMPDRVEAHVADARARATNRLSRS